LLKNSPHFKIDELLLRKKKKKQERNSLVLAKNKGYKEEK